MTTSKEITATEKLLDLIRASSSPAQPEAPAAGQPGQVAAPATAARREEKHALPVASAAAEKEGQPETVSPLLDLSSLSLETPAQPPSPEPTPEGGLGPAPDLVLTLEEITLEPQAESPPPPPPVAEAAAAAAEPPPPLSPPAPGPDEALTSMPLGLEAADDQPPVADAQPLAASPASSPPAEPAPAPPDQPVEAPVPQAALQADAAEDEEGEEDEDEPLGKVAADLADIIPRGEEAPAPAPDSFLHQLRVAMRQGLGRFRVQSGINVAIDIQPGMIHLAKTLVGKQGNELLAYQSVPYSFDPEADSGPLYESQPFRETLFRALSEFVSGGNQEFWCSFSFCTPVLLNITVPKVPDKDLANAVFWSAKRELEFDETEKLFDYTVLQELNDGGQAKIQTLATLVPKAEVHGLVAMFRDAGFPLTGLSFPAAAIQNFLCQDDAIPQTEPVAYFTIRKGCSFIDLYYRGKMFFSREIKTGADSFVEALVEHAMAQNIVITEERAREYLFPAYGGPELVNDEFLPLISFESLKVIDRLVRQLVRTFEYCGTTFKIPAVNRIVTSGEFTPNETILHSIESRSGIPCSVIDPLNPDIFQCPQEALPANTANLLVAAGLSLSDSQRTVNFLVTHADRERQAVVNRINAVIGLVTICLAVGCAAFIGWQLKRQIDQQAKVSALRTELNQRYQAEPRSRSGDYTNQTIQKISQFHKDNKAKLTHFRVVAMVSEVAKAVDKDINLTDLVLTLEAKKSDAKGKPEAAGSGGTLTIAGYISAPPESQEFVLMNLVQSLTKLSLVGSPEIKVKEKTTLLRQDVLRFELGLKPSSELLEPAGT